MYQGKYVFAIITYSDSREPGADAAGDALTAQLAEAGWLCRTHMVVGVMPGMLSSAIKRCTDQLKVDVLFTCGADGAAAIESLCDMEAEALAGVRAEVAAPSGLRGSTVVVSLPLSVEEALTAGKAAVEVVPDAVNTVLEAAE